MPKYLSKFKSYDADYNRVPQQMGAMAPVQSPMAPHAPAQAPPMPTQQRSPLDDVLSDQDFIGLPDTEKLKVISALDQDFAGLPPQEQSRALQMMIQPQGPETMQPKDIGRVSGVPQNMAQMGLQESWIDNPSNMSKIYRPVLEGLGMLGGGLVGALAGSPTGPGALATGAALAGTGYAIGRSAADWLDYVSGVKKQEPTGKEAYKQAAVDVATGATYDLGGQIFTAALMPTVNGVGYVFRKAKGGIRDLLSKKAVEESAGRVLLAETSEGVTVAKNIKQAREIEALLNKNAGPNDPKVKFSWAQLTDSPGAIKTERALTRQPGPAANIQAEQIANNNAGLTRYYDENFGGDQGVDDLLQALTKRRSELQARAAGAQEAAQDVAGGIPRTSPGETGRQITGELEAARAPYKSAMSELESQIPDYPMKFESTMGAIKDQLASRKISMSQRQALETAQSDIQTILGEGSTTHAAFGVRRTLNDRISEAFRAGNDSVGAILMKVKAGVDADLADVAAMARTGKIMDYRGKAVDVDKLSSTLESNTQQIAKLRGSKTLDTQKMYNELRERGGPSSGIWMRQVKEGEKAYTERLANEYERTFGKPAPTFEDANIARQVSGMEARNQEIRDILKEVNPGQDVASLMKAYNDFASSEFFSRFGTSSVKGVLQKGAQATGKKIAAESVPAKFLTESGSDDLIRAIGKEKAGGIMKGHFAYDMWQASRNQVTGQLEGKALAKWYNRNSKMLKKFGVAEDFNRIQSAQAIADEAAGAAAQFEKSAASRALAADPGRAIANAIKGNTTGKAAKELLAMVKGDAAATAGLRRAFADHIRQQITTTAKDIAGQKTISNAAFQRVMSKYQPAIDALYKESPKQAQALDTMRRSYEIMVRNTKSPIGGGSDTAENLFGAIADKMHISRTASAVKALVKVFRKANQQQQNEILTRAFFEPEYAETLIGLVKGQAPTRQIEKIINQKIINLDAYRRSRVTRAAAAGVLGMVGNGGTDRVSDRQ